MNRYILTLVIILSSFSAIAQKISLSGSVSDNKNQPLLGVQILLKERDSSSILAFAISSNSGEFSLKKELHNIDREALVVEFSFMGFATKRVTIPKDGDRIDVQLELKAVKIKEVVVNVQDIMQQHDTVTYRVASFASIEDRTISDVLKKMPGIEVLDSGAIKYQGRNISKFYIEGSDMLGGRYSLATNNISHEDVQSVEVMENHQPIKAIEDVSFSDATAMNIKLKEDAKSRWAGTAKVGGGLPGLWVGELFTMRFKKAFQTINSYKTNNTGGNSSDFSLFFSDSDFGSLLDGGSLTNYINVAPTTASQIGSHRSSFNNDHNLSTNNLFKFKNGYDLNSEIIATHQRRESEYIATTTYTLPDGKVNIEDKSEGANSLTKSISGNVGLKANKSSLYLNNNLDFSYEQSYTDIGVNGTYSNIQHGAKESYRINNDFDILRRKGDNLFTYRSSIGFASLPQSLTVTTDDESINQDIELSSFHFNNSYDYSIAIGKFRLTAPINLNWSYRNMRNTLANDANQTATHKIYLNTTPSFRYDINSVIFNINANIYYQPLNISKSWYNIYGVNPSASFTWIVSPQIKFRASGRYNNGMPDESRFYDGYIMSNYRTLNLGYIDMQTGHSSTASAGIEYKDVLKSLFATLNFNYSKSLLKRVSAQDFEDEYIIYSFIPGEQSTQNIMVSGNIGLGIDAINGSISIAPTFVKSQSTIVRNFENIPYENQRYSTRLSINSEIAERISLQYNANGSYSKYRSDYSSDFSTFVTLSQKAKLSYAPIKKVQLHYNIEHYCNELEPSKFKNFLFSDISASYLWGDRTEITLSVKNLFNEKHYTYFTESDLSSFYRDYIIRPRNILLEAIFRF